MTWTSRLRLDAAEMVREQVEYRELLYRMVARDLMLRYKQTVMGFGWAVFMPIVNTIVFSVIFTRVTKIDTGTTPYPLFAFTGFLAWNFFASSLRFAVSSLSSNAVLVSKVYFPREIFPFSTVIVGAVDLSVASTVLIAMMVYYHTPVGAAVLWLPLVFLVHAIFTAGLALVLSMANLFYRDVKYLFEVGITAMMFGTSVVYPVELVGGNLGVLLHLNPMTAIIDAYRRTLLQNEHPLTPTFLGATVVALLVLAVAWLQFHRSEFEFAENV